MCVITRTEWDRSTPSTCIFVQNTKPETRVLQTIQRMGPHFPVAQASSPVHANSCQYHVAVLSPRDHARHSHNASLLYSLTRSGVDFNVGQWLGTCRLLVATPKTSVRNTGYIYKCTSLRLRPQRYEHIGKQGEPENPKDKPDTRKPIFNVRLMLRIHFVIWVTISTWEPKRTSNGNLPPSLSRIRLSCIQLIRLLFFSFLFFSNRHHTLKNRQSTQK